MCCPLMTKASYAPGRPKAGNDLLSYLGLGIRPRGTCSELPAHLASSDSGTLMLTRAASGYSLLLCLGNMPLITLISYVFPAHFLTQGSQNVSLPKNSAFHHLVFRQASSSQSSIEGLTHSNPSSWSWPK